MRTLSLEATYGALRVSTRFVCEDDWETPTMSLQIDNDLDSHVRIRFSDPESLDHVAATIRDLQKDLRRYRNRLGDRTLHLASHIAP